MKVNEAPEKIYCVAAEGGYYLTAIKSEPPFAEAIEYTRTDAFIEKACEFLSNEANIPLWEGYDNTFGCDITKLIDNFKKYMKGEHDELV